MTKRREFGNITKLPSGRFRARYTDRATGGVITGPQTFSTRTAAQEWLNGQRTDLERGDWTDPRSGRQTVREWAEVWLTTAGGLRDKTLHRYRSALACQVYPLLGDIPVAEVTIPVVRKFVAELERQGCAPNTVKKSKYVLSATMRTALEAGAIRNNPCTGVRVAGGTKKKVRPLTAAQVEDLAEAMSAPQYALLVRLTAYCGLRASEAGALRRKHFDLAAQVVTISDTLSDVGGVLTFFYDETKTASSTRMVRWLDGIHDEIVDHLAGIGDDPNTLVFTSPTGGPLRHTNFYKRDYKPAVARAELPANTQFHDLRHTCASLLIAHGTPMEVVSKILGHSSLAITADLYTHLYDEYLHVASSAMDAAVGAARSTGGNVVPLYRPQHRTG